MPDIATPPVPDTGAARPQMRIGERIRASRTEQGLTLDEVSRRSGVVYVLPEQQSLASVFGFVSGAGN